MQKKKKEKPLTNNACSFFYRIWIFDWDDTLCPTHAIQQSDIIHSCNKKLDKRKIKNLENIIIKI